MPDADDNAKLPPPMSAREWAVVARNRKTEIEALRAEKLHYVSLIAQKDRVIERLQNELAKRDYGTAQIMRDEIEKERAEMGESDDD